MKSFVIEYTPNKEARLTTMVSAPTYTRAYLEFMRLFPGDFEIVEIREVAQ